jgi:hypothetical protein
MARRSRGIDDGDKPSRFSNGGSASRVEKINQLGVGFGVVVERVVLLAGP